MYLPFSLRFSISFLIQPIPDIIMHYKVMESFHIRVIQDKNFKVNK